MRVVQIWLASATIAQLMLSISAPPYAFGAWSRLWHY